jgi:BirA family biotin operon repressor/biotin-[acetyl-CoA-carboxylase] ligase
MGRQPQLDIERVRGALAQYAWTVEWLEECGSTNAELIERARAGAAGRMVLVAERQTAGRGRRGASWIASPGSSLTFSVLWESRRPTSAFGLIPLAAGVGCARALAKLGATAVRLKWPNDLVMPEGKLGGILVESVMRSGRVQAAVIGIGINLAHGESLSERLRRPVADLARVCVVPPREEILSEMLAQLEAMLTAFEGGRDEDIVQAWSGYDALCGCEVEIDDGEHPIRGIARGVAASGALCIDTPQGPRTVYAGAASVKRP